MTKHTPGKYELEPARSLDLVGEEIFCIRIYSEDPGSDRDFTVALVRDVDPTVRSANAEFIVRACNNHYELLEALKSAPIKIESETYEQFYHAYASWLRTDRKQAIAKAEGK